MLYQMMVFFDIKSVEYGNDDEVFLVLNIIVGL